MLKIAFEVAEWAHENGESTIGIEIIIGM